MKKVLKTTNTIIYSLLFILLLVSFAIGFVLLCWPLYYLMIDLFNITNLTGVSKADLIFSFNELMSCLVFYKEPFSEGVFAFSESGMNHFLDCRILFTLDLVVFAISLPLFFIYLLLILSYNKFIYQFNFYLSIIKDFNQYISKLYNFIHIHKNLLNINFITIFIYLF